MIYFIIFISLIINFDSPIVQGAAQKTAKSPKTTLPAKTAAKVTTKLPGKGAAKNTTKPPLTTLSGKAGAKITTKPPQTPVKGAAQNGTKLSETTLPAKVIVKMATKPPHSPTTGSSKGVVHTAVKIGPTIQPIPQDWHATAVKLVQPEVTRIVYITKEKEETTPPAQVTTQSITAAPSTTLSPDIEGLEVVVEVVQEAVTAIIYETTETPVIDCCGYVNTGVHCPPKYEMINSHCYHFSEKRVSWDVAMGECEELGGRLAVIENPNTFKESIGQNDGNGSIFWVGGIHSNGSWEWIDGKKLDAEFPWGLQKQLNGTQQQSCLMLNQQMGVYIVNHKEPEGNEIEALEDDHTVKIAGGGFTNDRCNKSRRFICDSSPTGNVCPTMYEKNPELAGLSSIESLIISNTRRAPKYPAKCPKNFQNVSGICVYFSEVKKCWEDATVFCKNLRIGTAREVTLAVLTEDVTQNHKLLEEIAKRGRSVWLGGFRDQLSMNHIWVDGSPVNLGECHWNETEPDHSGNCISAEVKMMLEARRTYLYDEECATPKYFVCRATCPEGFEEYGDSCYSFSHEPVTWKTAQKWCRDLSIGLDQNVHLATFGGDTEDDMNLLAEIAFQEKGLYHCFRGELIGHQCYHFQSDKMDWESARRTCEQAGMILAEPRDPHALASFMQNKSMTGEYHLGGHYLDGRMVWNYQDGFVFPNDLSVWIKGFPVKNCSVESTLSMTLDIDGPLYIQIKGNHAKFICEEKNNYWVGGSRTYFKDWVWTNGKQVDLNSPYFAKKEPRLENDLNCLIAEQSESTPNKAFLKSDSCGSLNRYICQASDINPFGREFVQIGDGYYYISTMNNQSVTTWQAARDICHGLEVPEMYTVDLAVLNRQDQRDSAFEIDFLSMNKGFSLWIGARAVTTNDVTNWVWVNTQPQHQEVLQPESIYWSLDLDTTPIEGANVYLTWDKWETSFDDVKHAIATQKKSIIARTFQGFRKPVLYWEHSDSTTLRAFVCQVFDKA